MKIKYNAPVILTFALVSAGVLVVAQILGPQFVLQFFSVPGYTQRIRLLSPEAFRLITHVIGHGSWLHLMSNFAFVLLIGPILEEKYGSGPLFVMMLVTALVTGILNMLLFPAGLLGASGIVFMLILLISFTNIREGEIPLTFILVVLLFLVKEILSMFESNNISEFAHIVGGICGALFGFLFRGRTIPTADAPEDPYDRP
jgi:membrane associated rhomboid family serine protease